MMSKIPKLSVKQIKKRFEIYLYLIDKKYLNYYPHGDSPYQEKEKYVEKLFTVGDNGKWKFLSSVKINSDEENREYLKEVNKFIDSKIEKTKERFEKELLKKKDKYILESGEFWGNLFYLGLENIFNIIGIITF